MTRPQIWNQTKANTFLVHRNAEIEIVLMHTAARVDHRFGFLRESEY